MIPSFLMVVAISMAYVAYGGLWWMQALFYAIGATVIAIIAIAAYKLARSTNKRDPLLWGIFALLTGVTVWAQAELAEFFILAGLVVLLVRAWPGWKMGSLMALGAIVLGLGIWVMEAWLRQDRYGSRFCRCTHSNYPIFHQGRRFCVRQWAGNYLVTATGSGAAIWLAQRAPVLGCRGGGHDHARSRGYHSRFYRLPRCRLARVYHGSDRHLYSVYLSTIVPAPWFKRHRDNPQLRAFVDGATASATGAITGAVVLLGARAIMDVPTALIGLISLAVLWRYKVSEPVIVTISGLVGLILWPLMRVG